jgi:hypothetical protein
MRINDQIEQGKKEHVDHKDKFFEQFKMTAEAENVEFSKVSATEKITKAFEEYKKNVGTQSRPKMRIAINDVEKFFNSYEIY